MQGRWFYLYLILDLFSRQIVGFEVHDSDTAEHAAHLARRTALAEGVHAMPLRPVLHGDNGATLKATTVLAMLHWLGISPSYSRPRVSDDNAFAEALFRTAKYRPEFPAKGFADLEAARAWAARFVQWYNDEHRHSGIRYVTPAQRHAGEDGRLLGARHAVYQEARERNPRRWSRHTRTWTPVATVTLNPERDAVTPTGVAKTQLSGSIGAPAFPPRPGYALATARNEGDGRSGATRSHAQRSEHGEDGEHRTFPAVSTVAGSGLVGLSAASSWRTISTAVRIDGASLRGISGNYVDTHRPPDSVLADLLKSDCGRLLATSKEQLFLIRPVHDAAGLDLDTFAISRKKAEALRIRADYGSCL